MTMAFTMVVQLPMWAGAIGDVSGYVVLSTTDPAGTSSFSSSGHWSDGFAPSAGKHYLVNDGKQLRTPEGLTGQTIVFAGDTCTLDNGRLLFKSYYLSAYAHWIVYGNSSFAAGWDGLTGYICGDIACRTTAEAPLKVVVQSNRSLYLDAALTGDETTAICATRESTESDSASQAGNVVIRGNNAHYAGTFAVNRGDSNVEATVYRLSMASQAALGAANSQRPKLTLTGPNVVFRALSPLAFGAGYDLSVSDIAYIESPNTLGAGLSGYGVCESLYFGEGARISGSGDAAKLIFRDCAATFGRVQINGLAELAGESSATMRLTRDCIAAGVPVTICGLGEIDALGLASVTVQGGSLAAGIGLGAVGCCGCESLVVNNGSLRISVAQGEGTLTNDTFEIAGDLTVTGEEPVRIVFDSMPKLESGTKLPLVFAKNLATLGAGVFSLDNSVYSGDIAGTFSVEEIAGRNCLVFNYQSGSIAAGETVEMTQTDARNTTSFDTALNWSDGKAPHEGAHYVVKSDMRLRAYTKNAIFKGKSLTVENGGNLAIGGVAVQIDNLRLHSGAFIDAIVNGEGNRLCGSATLINDDANLPVVFRAEGDAEGARLLTVPMTIKGDGALQFTYDPDKLEKMQPDPIVGYSITGENGGFTGSIELSQYGIYTEFTDEKAMGGPAAEFSPDRLRFTKGAELRVRSGYAMKDATRGICFGEGGGSINVYYWQTLTVSNHICGTSKIVKKGEGTLEFCGEGDGFSGTVDHRRGTLVIGSDGVFGTLSGVVCSGSALWRIGAPDGLKVVTVDAIDTTSGKLRLRSDIIDASLAAGESGYVRAKLLTVQSATVDQAQDLMDKIEYVPARELKEGEGPLVIKCVNGGGKLSVYCCLGVNRGFKVIVR